MAKDLTNMGMSHNVLAAGTKVVGKITTDSDFRVDGSVEGDMICQGKVVFGTQGSLQGNLICGSAEIMGKINGTITAKEVLSLKSTAKVTGDIKTKTLVIEPEALFNGNCSMTDSAISSTTANDTTKR